MQSEAQNGLLDSDDKRSLVALGGLKKNEDVDKKLVQRWHSMGKIVVTRSSLVSA